jgi:chitin disaccharide deacetylase
MNPFLAKLGYGENDRVVILHADDIGMCQASVDAYADLLEFGIMSSAATMAPCPWYPAAAEYFKQVQTHPNFDIGVHCTLNSEWSTFRWGPLSTRDASTGLLDADGYFYNLSEPTQEKADPAAVEAEILGQAERVLSGGFDVTHMDSHMITLFHPPFIPPYLRVAQKYNLPAFVMSPDHKWVQDWTDEERAPLHDAAARGMPLFDYFDALSLSDPTNRLEQARQMLAETPAGLSALVFHPVRDSAEVRAMAWDWECRVADHALYSNPEFRQVIADSGVHVIGYRKLRDAMRAQTQ